MKKLMIRMCSMVCVAALAVVSLEAFTGCKSVPTDDQMYMTSFAIGASAGLVADQLKGIDDTVRTQILEVVDIVAAVVPKTNETFEVVWGTAAKVYTAELVEKQKIDAGQATLIVGGVQLAGRGVDYVFIRYPKAKQYEELVSSAVAGATDGFKTTFKPSNDSEARGLTTVTVTYDADAYDWLKNSVK